MNAHHQAIAAQAEAANPQSSAFVSANAGSGKTHVLINRVTRLLMAGVQPQNILCVTYTKAAAAEMLNRLFDRLGGYSVMQDDELGEALRELDPQIAIGKVDLRRARALFALALETPGGLKIRTIHSFCESLLRRFPAEAGISPGFTVLDDRQTADIRHDCIASIGLEALAEPDGPIATAIEHTASLGAEALDSVYSFALAKGRPLTAMINRQDGLDGAIALSTKQLGLEPNTNTISETETGWHGLDHLALKRLANALNDGKATDQKCAAKIAAALHADTANKSLEALFGGFFTLAGTPIRALPTGGIRTAHPWVVELIPAIQEQLSNIRQRLHAVAVLENTRAALVLGQALHQRYCAAKQHQGALDFDDLIAISADLVSRSDAAQWVLYKLDYNLSHILVDEAQDNSDGQWQLVRSLSREFFAGKGAQEESRTLFAVGDPKQSIYSFQGANPALFLQEAEALKIQTLAREARFTMPELALSWRSCPQILSMVDEAFLPFISASLEKKFAGDPADFEKAHPKPPEQVPEQAPGFDNYINHQAQRADHNGSVELWDPVARPVDMPEEDPGAPVDAPAPQSARNVLAANIAINIEDWLQRGELVGVKEDGVWRQRAIRPGDIMILVKKRSGGLFEEIIRQLKSRGVPVAGADRMVLNAQIAVRDCLSAAKAAVQDADDLSLAEFLRSPFLQPAKADAAIIDESALYNLAADRPRGQSLSHALHLNEDPRFDEARTLMAHLRRAAAKQTPFGFFASLLFRQSQTGESYAKRLYARLGREAEDPVREFLSNALAHQNQQAPALVRFIAQSAQDEAQIKREMEGASNAVRVMTVHAAKGLEAPLVILPDTASGPGRPRSSGLMFGPQDALLWSPKKQNDPAICAGLREQEAALDRQEHLRLLYVAMTRAQDRLIICGAQMGHGEGRMEEDSWYTVCANAFARKTAGDEIQAFETKAGNAAKRYGPVPKTTASNAAEAPFVENCSVVALPDWATKPLVAQAPAPRRAAPSRWMDDDDELAPVMSPLADGGAKRFKRGLLIHTLLQSLPDMAVDLRPEAAQNYLAAQPDLDAGQIDEIIAAVFGVLEEPAFAALFGPNSRAEIPISGHAADLADNLIIAGQIDRILVTEEQVLVVDFKTNRPAPKRAEDVPKIYLQQMRAYRALLRELWPNREIHCALLWTDGPALMPLAQNLLDVKP